MRVNYLECDVCGYREHEGAFFRFPPNDRKIDWLCYGDGKHACSVECYIKANPLGSAKPVEFPPKAVWTRSGV